MRIEVILISITCLISLLNLFSTIFLSNALFKVFAPKPRLPKPESPEVGLVDLPEVATYDPRFLEKNF